MKTAPVASDACFTRVEGNLGRPLSGKIGEVDCTVVSTDELIRMKEIAARTRNLADIEKLRAGNAE